jgi:hypothetical protein
METREASAQAFEQLAADLEKAAAHYRVAAGHFRAQEVPRACAHACAAQGHVETVQEGHRRWLRLHAERSSA